MKRDWSVGRKENYVFNYESIQNEMSFLKLSLKNCMFLKSESKLGKLALSHEHL